MSRIQFKCGPVTAFILCSWFDLILVLGSVAGIWLAGYHYGVKAGLAKPVPDSYSMPSLYSNTPAEVHWDDTNRTPRGIFRLEDMVCTNPGIMRADLVIRPPKGLVIGECATTRYYEAICIGRNATAATNHELVVTFTDGTELRELLPDGKVVDLPWVIAAHQDTNNPLNSNTTNMNHENY